MAMSNNQRVSKYQNCQPEKVMLVVFMLGLHLNLRGSRILPAVTPKQICVMGCHAYGVLDGYLAAGPRIQVYTSISKMHIYIYIYTYHFIP